MDSETIENIVAEIIRDEPGLAKFQAEVKAAVIALAQARPELAIDEVFKKNLRRKLLKKASNESWFIKYTNLSVGMKKSTRVMRLSGAVLVLVLAGIYIGINYQKIPGLGSNDKNRAVSVKRVGDQAFGRISLSNSTSTLSQGTDAAAGSLSAGEQAAGSAPAPVGARTAAGDSGAGIGVAPMPNQQTPNFQYKGEAFNQNESKLEVLKRINNEGVLGVGGILEGANLDFLKLDTFAKAKVRNLSLNIDNNSYQADLDLVNGRLSISVFGQGMVAYAEDAYKTSAEVLTDQEVIDIADKFIADYGLNISAYGRPAVEDWRSQGRLGVMYAPDYRPQQVSLTYPLMVNGRKVYDTSGNLIGINLYVDTRTRKVASLSNLITNRFEGSMYEAETDVQRILTVAQTGGLYDYYFKSENQVEVGLNKPELAYLMITQYDKSETTDLLVPALVFSVNKVEQVYSPDTIVVPLIKEILAERGAGTAPGIDSPYQIEPMPLPAVEKR